MSFVSPTDPFCARVVVLAGLLAALPLTALPAGAEDPYPALTPDPPRASPTELPELEHLESHYRENPELRTARSSGWKPYQRVRWLHETRVSAEGAASPAALRKDAFDTARSRIARRSAASPGWFSVGPTSLSGRAMSIDFDPRNPAIVFLGSATGGLWKSTDGGDTWAVLTDDFPTLAVGAVCVPASDPDIVLMGTGEGNGGGSANLALGPFGAGLWKSTDGGGTWNPTSLSYPLASAHGFNFVEDNPVTGTLLAGANDGLWRSADNGDTWTLVEGGGNFHDAKWKPGSATRVYATKGRDPFVNFQSDNGVKVSTDDGLTWALAGTGQPPQATLSQISLAVTPAAPATVYAQYSDQSTGYGSVGVYRSTDDGATWTARNTSVNTSGGQGWYNLVLTADPDNASRVVAGGVQLYESGDAGATLSILENGFVPAFGDIDSPHWDAHALVYEPGSTDNVWVLTDGGPWRSTDDGATWTSRREGLITYQFYDICVAQADSQFTVGGTQDNGIPTRAALNTWDQSTLVADGMVCNINPFNNTIYGEAQNGLHFKSNNRGQSWTAIQNGLTGTGIWVTPVDEDQNVGNHLYTATNTGIFRTTNGGNLWVNVASHFARWIDISPVDGNVVWTVSNFSGVWHTTDDGTTWTPSSTFPATGTETKIAAHPTDADQAFVTFGYYGTGSPRILRTTDRGASWLDVTGDFPDQPANTFIVDPLLTDHWYVGSDVGVWRSTDGGAHWAPYGTGLANALIVDLEIQRTTRKLVAGTHGRGAWEVDLAGAVDAPAVPAAAEHLMLDPPAPNPARDVVTFRFAARAAGTVTLDVFDVSGRKVDRVASFGRGDGIVRTALWEPPPGAAGVYFARLRSADGDLVRKVVVAK